MSDTSATDADWLHRRLQSATQLTELRDTESTLQVVVRHTRGLMDADMAYVSFTDFDSNETVIRKTDGVRTGEYASIRQPLGTGVLGRVAIGHASYWTSDYRADQKLHHMGPIDEIVEGEGVRALLGAPLSVAGRVIGALLIAFRSPREFSDTEVDRLESLADQAAVAIDNAQRHEQLMALVESDADQRGQRSDTDIAELSRSLDLDRRLRGRHLGAAVVLAARHRRAGARLRPVVDRSHGDAAVGVLHGPDSARPDRRDLRHRHRRSSAICSPTGPSMRRSRRCWSASACTSRCG